MATTGQKPDSGSSALNDSNGSLHDCCGHKSYDWYRCKAFACLGLLKVGNGSVADYPSKAE